MARAKGGHTSRGVYLRPSLSSDEAECSTAELHCRSSCEALADQTGPLTTDSS